MENETEDESSEAAWPKRGPGRLRKEFGFYSEPDKKLPEGLSRGGSGSD